MRQRLREAHLQQRERSQDGQGAPRQEVGVLCTGIVITGMVEKAIPRLRDRAYWLPLPVGVLSCNLGLIFLTIYDF